MNPLHIGCFLLVLLTAAASDQCKVAVPGTVRTVVGGKDLAVVLDDSFSLHEVTAHGQARGFAGYSSELKTSVLALTIPSTGSIINDELSIRNSLSSFSIRWRPRSLIQNPVITVSETWDAQETVRAQYDMSTDSNRAEPCGLKRRMNEIASKLLGLTVAPLVTSVGDLLVLARYGFLTSIELSRRGGETIVLVALSAADNTAASDVHELTTGSAHALAKDSVISNCTTVNAVAPKSVGILFYADPGQVMRAYRMALAGYVGKMFTELDAAGITWSASVVFGKTVPQFAKSNSREVVDALKQGGKSPKPTTGSPFNADVLAVVFVGDTDDFATVDASKQYFRGLSGVGAYRPIVFSGVLCPEGTRCKLFAVDTAVTRGLLKQEGGTAGWMRPTTAMLPAVRAIAYDIIFAAAGVTLPDFPIASTTRVSLPANTKTIGTCSRNDVPRSTKEGFLVRGKQIAFFGGCVLKQTPVAVSVAYSHFVHEAACVPTTEVCDGRDNDCDQLIDEGFDDDNDGYTVCGGDCNDTVASIHPNARELCNKIDDNCNGEVDEGCPDNTNKPYTVQASNQVICPTGRTVLWYHVTPKEGTSVSAVTIPLQKQWVVLSSEPAGTRASDGSFSWEMSLGALEPGNYTLTLQGVFEMGTVNLAIAGTTPASIAVQGPKKLLSFNTKPASPPKSMTYIGTIRDLRPDHPDVEGRIIVEKGIVQSRLGSDNMPLLTPGSHLTVQSATSFNSWWHDTASPKALQTKKKVQNFVFKNVGQNPLRYTLQSPTPDPFFPINGELWDDNKFCFIPNYYFTVELTIPFRYRGGDIVSVESDDDVWVFVDGKLFIDNGGVHPRVSVIGYLSTQNLAIGSDHELRIFFAERHVVESVFKITVPTGAYDCETRDFCGNCSDSACSSDMLSDSDGDAVIDCYDVCPYDATRWDATKPAPCPCGLGGDIDGDGRVDCLDGCPTDPKKVTPGQCGCGVDETADSDLDGILDCIDRCPLNPSPTCDDCDGYSLDTDKDGRPDCMDPCWNDSLKIDPGVCGCGALDTDTDTDGAPDCIDGCPHDREKIAPGVCGCGTSDSLDQDGDQTPDCLDDCPRDPAKTSPGECGCGVSDADRDEDNVPDCDDGCPDDKLKTEPGICGCGVSDTDTDGDGTADCNDGCRNDPHKTSPGICGCNALETDTDSDGTPDCIDQCQTDPTKVVQGICGCGVPDTDTDGDGTADCQDTCPTDPNKVVPVVCPCNVPDVDTDGDQVLDCLDGCPNDPLKTAPGICGCNQTDLDADADGWICDDECPNNPNLHLPGDCGCDAEEYIDSDHDGVDDCHDECPQNPLKTAPGQCGCSETDVDDDADGVPNCNDLCPMNPHKTEPGTCGCDKYEVNPCSQACPVDNPKQSSGQCGCDVPEVDADGDGYASPCMDECDQDPHKTSSGQCGCGAQEVDTDGDLTMDCVDGCHQDPLKTKPGVCGCGVSDKDTDGDETPDCNDSCPTDPGKVAAGLCGCGRSDEDTDSDGTPNCLDLCPEDKFKQSPGICGCGRADVDTDNDGTLDCNDDCPADATKTLPGFCGCGIPELDTDHDGTPDCVDDCADDPDKQHPGVCGCFMSDQDSDHDGTPDCVDGCINDPNKVAPGKCGCGTPDIDNDGDGWAACEENCDDEPLVRWYTMCGCAPEVDSDGDQVIDCLEDCPDNPDKQWLDPFGCGCDLPDIDSDGDDYLDICQDSCPYDPRKRLPGICGCNASDVDTDHDGTMDCNDQCPNDPAKVTPGACGCGQVDVLTDSDNDGVPDCVDRCPGRADRDRDGDGYVEYCEDQCDQDPLKIHPGQCGCNNPETDSDGDGRADCIDKCPLNPNFWNENQFCDRSCLLEYTRCSAAVPWQCLPYCFNDPIHYPDPCAPCPPQPTAPTQEKRAVAAEPPVLRPSCHSDFDADGTMDCFDGCRRDPEKILPGQCGCHITDVDSDRDGVPDCQDSCPNDPAKAMPLMCGCGKEETDRDGDRVPDCWDACPTDPKKTWPGACGCNAPEASQGGDSDGDGAPDCRIYQLRHAAREDTDKTTYCADCLDQCPYDPTHIVRLKCGCGQPETDTDGDNEPDCTDACPNDARKISPGICGCGQVDLDSDNDRTPDCRDRCPFDPLSTTPASCGCGLDELQCEDIRRASESKVAPKSGLSSGVIAIITIAAVLVAAAVIIATVVPLGIVRYRRHQAEKAVPLENAGTWKRPTVWRNGTVAAGDAAADVQDVSK